MSKFVDDLSPKSSAYDLHAVNKELYQPSLMQFYFMIHNSKFTLPTSRSQKNIKHILKFSTEFKLENSFRLKILKLQPKTSFNSTQRDITFYQQSYLSNFILDSAFKNLVHKTLE